MGGGKHVKISRFWQVNENIICPMWLHSGRPVYKVLCSGFKILVQTHMNCWWTVRMIPSLRCQSMIWGRTEKSEVRGGVTSGWLKNAVWEEGYGPEMCISSRETSTGVCVCFVLGTVLFPDGWTVSMWRSKIKKAQWRVGKQFSFHFFPPSTLPTSSFCISWSSLWE